MFSGREEPNKIWMKYSKDFTRGCGPFTIDELLDEIPNINEDEQQWNIYYRKDDEYHYDHSFSPRRVFEPVGEYILLGRGRDGLPQYQINGNGNTTFIGSVFTFGFLIEPEKGGCITYKEISQEEFKSYIEKMHTYDYWRPKHELYVNFNGHEQNEKLLKKLMNVYLPQNRITIRARPGDKVVWAQYKGPRLEEGMITVPDKAKFTPMKAEIYDSKMMDIVNQISQAYLKGITRYVDNDF